MKLNRTSLYVMLLVLVNVLLAACGGKANSPAGAASKFVDAIIKGDTGTATQLLTAEMRQHGNVVTQAAAKDIPKHVPKDGKINVTVLEEVGNTARVRVETDVTVTEVFTRNQVPGSSYLYPFPHFTYYSDELKDILSEFAYTVLIEDDYGNKYVFRSVLDGISSASGEFLYVLLREKLTEETFIRWLYTPPSLDRIAVASIEAIATEIAVATGGAIDLDAYRDRLRPHLDTIGEYLAYRRLIKRAASLGDLRVDPDRKTFVHSLYLTLHKVDDKWLVAPGS